MVVTTLTGTTRIGSEQLSGQWGRPCKAGRSNNSIRVCSGVDVLWPWSGGQLFAGYLSVPQDLQSFSDDGVCAIELVSSCVCIDGVGDLIVTALVQGAQVEPDL